METYICENVFVPLRAAPAHKSEMLSQILFGEKYNIVDKSGNWLKIKTLFDSYLGWIDADHLQFSIAEGNSQGYVLNRSLVCIKNDKTSMVLEAGCEVYDPDFDEKIFTVGKNTYYASSGFSRSCISTSDALPDIAMKFINSPYLWGGRVPSGIDCSGLTQLAYKIFGIPIARDAAEQAEEGKLIDFIDDAYPGDLAFFGNNNGRITHVGMIISRGLILHASGRVRLDTVDHQGIFKNEINGYSHSLRTIRRVS